MITELATDDVHWNGWTPEGMPGLGLFSNALQVWSVAQERSTSVEEEALVFNVRPELIQQAVEDHLWMSVSDGMICHDGE